jgi:hypothetical protein
MQLLLTIVMIAVSVMYAAKRFYKCFLAKNNPCAGCEGCALKRENSKNCGHIEKNKQKNLVKTKK